MSDVTKVPRQNRACTSYPHDVSIAYQVMGDGPIDIILLPGSLSHVEASLMPRTYLCAQLLETLD